MPRRLPLPVLTVLLALALAGPASAAYAPKFTVKVDPATPSAAAAISTTVTQAPGETPNKQVTVAFPVGFSANLDARPVICTPEQEATKVCPPETQIGTAAATASVGPAGLPLGAPVDLPGTVHYGGADKNGIKLIVFLRSQVAGDQTIEGFVQFRADGGFNVVFGPLPNTLTTSFTLSLQGGDKALSLTPRLCGDYVFKASFLSQNGEQATSDATTTIGGCQPRKLEIANVDATRTGTATFNLTAAASGTVTIKRGTKKIVAKAFTGKSGVNRVKTGKTLKPGSYRVKVQARTPDGQALSSMKTVRISKS